eukprot:6181810-Pleurochrysis_carterae.AAC.4
MPARAMAKTQSLDVIKKFAAMDYALKQLAKPHQQLQLARVVQYFKLGQNGQTNEANQQMTAFSRLYLVSPCFIIDRDTMKTPCAPFHFQALILWQLAKK